MKVLIVGSGSQEHALAWKLSQSRHITRIYCCPGNPGIAQIAECIDIQPSDLNALVDFVKYEWIDLTLITDAALLMQGLADLFEREGCRVMGPNRAASRLGQSRAAAKNLIRLSGIPTPEFKVFTSYLHAQDYIRLKGAPVVIKLDEPFVMPGIFSIPTVEEAVHVLRLIMQERIFSNAGTQVIVEAPLSGEPVTCVALSDGKDIVPFSTMKRYGHIIEGGSGLARLGMGATGRGLHEPGETDRTFEEKILKKILKVFQSEGIRLKGMLSADIMVQKDKVYLCDMTTFGRGLEMETLLPCLKTDFAEVALAVAGERISDLSIAWSPVSSICIEVCSGDREEGLHTGMHVTGLEELRSSREVFAFHNSTSLKNEELQTSGPHVLSISAVGQGVPEARTRAYDALERIRFEGMRYRQDVGSEKE